MQSQSKRILIIEDEKPMAKALELKLTKAGFAVKVVFNGQEALSELEKESYDLLLLDLLMPGVDGWEVLAKVQAKKMKVMVLSNLSQQEDSTKAKAMGAIDFLVKSDITLEEVVKKVTAILKD